MKKKKPSATPDTQLGLKEFERMNSYLVDSLAEDAWYRQGAALQILRNTHGYLHTSDSFRAYCGDVLGITDNYARRLIRGKIIAERAEIVIGERPSSEAVARELWALLNDDDEITRTTDQGLRFVKTYLRQHNSRTLKTATAKEVRASVKAFSQR